MLTKWKMAEKLLNRYLCQTPTIPKWSRLQTNRIIPNIIDIVAIDTKSPRNIKRPGKFIFEFLINVKYIELSGGIELILDQVGLRIHKPFRTKDEVINFRLWQAYVRRSSIYILDGCGL